MKTIVLALSIVFLSGCSLMSLFDGKFSRSDWQIEKIVIDGKDYPSPQLLKAQVVTQLESEGEDLQQSNQDVQNKADEEDAIQPDLQQNTSLPLSDENEKKPASQEDLLDFDGVATMVFDQSQNRIYGIAGCNNYFASYSWRDSEHIEVDNTGMSRKLCSPDEVMSFEFRFLRNFSGVFKIIKDKTSMVLDNGKMQIYLQ